MYRLKAPLRAQLELTEACNNACVHCYNYWRYQETGAKLTTDDHVRPYEHFESLLDVVIAQDIKTITFTGGEPFLRRDVLFRLIQKGKSAGLRVFVNTNAALITKQDTERLQELEVDALLVSLLSHDANTHNTMTHSSSHSGTIRGVKLLLEANLPVSINMVTSRDNWQHVRQTAQLVHDLGGQSFSATPMLSCHLSAEHDAINLSPEQIKKTMHDLLWAKEELGLDVTILEPLVHCLFTAEERELFSQLLHSRYCCAGITDCVISPDGELRPCILSTDIGGNIIEVGWQVAWQSLSRWKEPVMLPAECLECSAVDDCGGGCRAAAKAKYGQYNDKDPLMVAPISGKITDNAKEQKRRDRLPGSRLLTLRTGLGLRSEDFGGMLFYNDSQLFLKHEAFLFAQQVLKLDHISVDSVSESQNVNIEDVRSFLQTLVDGGYLIPTTKEV
jgi:radical SAM protein with 4Fe4S-binding SPASM domain